MLRGLTCNISLNRLACGSRNLVLEVAFSNSTYWIVRIRLPGVDNDTEDEVEKAMRSEVATMHLVQEKTSIPVATVFGYGTKQENLFGYPYMFMSVLPGRHLKSNFGSSVPKKHQAKVAEQFAQILHQLNTRMTFDMIGRIWCGESGNEAPSITSFNTIGACGDEIVTYPIGPFSTSLEYFYALRQHENAAVRAGIQQGILGQDDEETWYTACRVFEQSLSPLVLMERMSGPYPLKHMDLHYNNILLDDDFNITGVVDWTGSQTVPRESLPVGVEFITPPGAPAELVANKAAFGNLVRKAWKKKESEAKCVCSTARAWAGSESEFTCVCSIPDILGSTRADLINFSSTLGALRRSVAYAQIVTPLLYGPGFSLDNFKKNREGVVNCMTNCR